MWEHRKRAFEHEAHQFPVAGDRVLAGRRLRHPAECPDRFGLVRPTRLTVDTRVRPSRRRFGTASGMRREMLPSVSLPVSP